MQSSLGRGDENLRDLFGRATARGHTRKKGEIKRVIKDRHIAVAVLHWHQSSLDKYQPCSL